MFENSHSAVSLDRPQLLRSSNGPVDLLGVEQPAGRPQAPVFPGFHIIGDKVRTADGVDEQVPGKKSGEQIQRFVLSGEFCHQLSPDDFRAVFAEPPDHVGGEGFHTP